MLNVENLTFSQAVESNFAYTGTRMVYIRGMMSTCLFICLNNYIVFHIDYSLPAVQQDSVTPEVNKKTCELIVNFIMLHG
jgi:hypothetical protein